MAGVKAGTTEGEEVEGKIDQDDGLNEALLWGTLTAGITLGLLESDDCTLKPGENVLDRFVDHTRLGSNFLLKHERAGGHTNTKHIGKDITFLQTRLNDEGLEDASTFDDMPIAEREVKRGVTGSIPRITRWYQRGRNGELHVPHTGGSETIGFGITKEDPSKKIPKYHTLVRLLAAPACQILILTAYPK